MANVVLSSSAFLLLCFSNNVATSTAQDGSNTIACDPCIDRQSVTIGVVHHGVPTDVFWQSMDIAIEQGAKDMNIRLLYNPLNGSLLDQDAVFQDMSTNIETYCRDDTVNAILVSLPSETILPSLETCQQNDIPIAVFNAGSKLSKGNGLLFVGQDETDAGYEAGAGLARVNTTEKFCCTNAAVGVDVLTDRCDGMAMGVESIRGPDIDNSTYSKTHVVATDPTDCDAWKSAVLQSCSPDEGKDWSTVGLYLAGQPDHECGVIFLEEYRAAYASASDVSTELYAGMVIGLNILFGIDQQSYLQGYLPFSFLTLAVTNGQLVLNEQIKTGPALVKEPPSEHIQICTANDFAVCADDSDDDDASSTPNNGGVDDPNNDNNGSDGGSVAAKVDTSKVLHIGYLVIVFIISMGIGW